MSLRHGSHKDLIYVPLLLLITMGLFYNFTYADMCQVSGKDVCANPVAWVNGNPTSYNGCVVDCAVTPINFLTSSPFSFLATGDIIGFVTAFFSSPQSVISVLSLFAGVVLLLMGLGIGFSAQALASGASIQFNEQGTRLAQSFGIGLILWGAISTAFGGWFNAFGFGLGLILNVLLLMLYTVGLYDDARSIV